MKTKIISLFFILFLLTLHIVILDNAKAVDPVEVDLNCPGTVNVGFSFDVIVDITDVVDFDAANFDISFDDTLVSITGVSNGLIGGETVPADMWTLVDSDTLRVIVNVPGLTGVSGSGYLAVIHCMALDTGSCDFILSDCVLSDITSTEIPSVCFPCTTEITEVTVPVNLNCPTSTFNGNAFDLVVEIDNVNDFDAANFDITFDNSLVSITGVSSGLINGTTVLLGAWDLIDVDKLRIIVNIPGVTGASGSGYLAVIHCLALDVGSCDFVPSNYVLSSIYSTEIPSSWAMDSININNNPPVVSDIPSQTILEGESFTTINLDNYVTDVEDADEDISWSYSGDSFLDVDITDRVATITTPGVNWNGAETITFTATDTNSATDFDPATFTVTAVNDPPVVSNIPGQTILEGESFTTINLNNYVDDVETDDLDIIWTYTGDVNLTIIIINQIATISPPGPDWNGGETITFIATDTGDGIDSPLSDFDTATFTITSENDPPVVSDIPNQTIQEGESFTAINLDNYVIDVEDSDADIEWSYSGNSELTVSIVDRVATITTPNIDWFGEETITFTANDTGDLTDFDTAIFNVTSVNDFPDITTTPLETIEEEEFYSVNFNADDPDLGDILNWNLKTDADFLSINSSTGNLTGTPDINDAGTYYVNVSVDDGNGGIDWINYTLTVTNKEDTTGDTDDDDDGDEPVNNPPLANASAGEPYIGFVGEEILFDGSLSSDPDTGDAVEEWYWDFGDGTNGTGVTVFHEYSETGLYNVSLTVWDNHGLKCNENYTTVVEITAANRPPSEPVISGPLFGNIDVEYSYTAISYDDDGDDLLYNISFGDGTYYETDYVEEGKTVSFNHVWENPGEYEIRVKSFDRLTESVTIIKVYIDKYMIDGEIKGFLIDTNSDGTYDKFENYNTGKQTAVEKTEKGDYLIDSNGDGEYDYVYDIEDQELREYKTDKEANWWENLAIITLIIIIIIGLLGLILIILKKL